MHSRDNGLRAVRVINQSDVCEGYEETIHARSRIHCEWKCGVKCQLEDQHDQRDHTDQRGALAVSTHFFAGVLLIWCRGRNGVSQVEEDVPDYGAAKE